jgi:hypothetical protein
MHRLSLAFLLVFALSPSLASATAMMEPVRHSFRIDFDNGDRLSIDWGNDEYVLSLLVNGKGFQFDAAALGVTAIYPDDANLYSGPNSGRNKYFSFDVSVACPEEVQPYFYSCKASALVQQGKPLEVDIHRFRPPEDYVFDPSAPPKPMSWEYTLLSPSREKLERLAPILEAMGYKRVLDIGKYLDWRKNQPSRWGLYVSRDEGFTPTILAQRKHEMGELAAKYGVEFHGVLLE